MKCNKIIINFRSVIYNYTTFVHSRVAKITKIIIFHDFNTNMCAFKKLPTVIILSKCQLLAIYSLEWMHVFQLFNTY